MREFVWLALGDSITEKSIRAEKNYHLLVKEELGCLHVLNAGEGGTGFRHAHKTRPPFYKRIERYEDYPIDFITILGGVNDVMLDDGYVGIAGDSFDESYMGCLDILIKKIRKCLPKALVAIISPVPQAQYRPGSGDELDNLVNELERYADENGIPFLDIYHDSPLKPWERENNRQYYSNPDAPEGDGLHPNLEGHKIMAAKITPFVGKIIEELIKKQSCSL